VQNRDILKYGESKILLRFGKSSVSQNKNKKRNKVVCYPLFLVASALFGSLAGRSY
jgi:hypothetical protein